MNVDCVRLPNRLFPRTDSEIEHRNRIQVEGNTGISVCLPVRLVGDDQRTGVFRCFRLDVGGGCLPQWPLLVDWFGDWPSRSDLVRLRGRGRFGVWLVMVWEPRDSAVLG